MRIGYSWPLGGGRRMWVSMSLGGWLLAWLLLAPFVAVWLAVWLLVHGITLAARGIAWLASEIRDRPAIPPKLRAPPGRGSSRQP